MLAFADQCYDDQERRFKTALLTDTPRGGVDVDHDFFADLLDEQRRAWERHDLLATFPDKVTP